MTQFLADQLPGRHSAWPAPVGQSPLPDANDPPANPTPAPETPPFKGYVDGLSHQWRVVGWASAHAAETTRLVVELVEDGIVLDTTMADMFRGDLLEATIGDGHFGFSLKIPPSRFDGRRHAFAIRAAGLPEPNVIGTLEVALPSRAPAKLVGQQTRTAREILQTILAHRPPEASFNPLSQAAELTRVLERIVQAYDHATALGLLYVHVLRRRIDHGGLQTRLTSLSKSPDQLAAVITEVLASEEAQALYKPGSDHRFPDIAALEVWTSLRRIL